MRLKLLFVLIPISMLCAPLPCAAKSALFIAVPPLRPWQWMQAEGAQGPDAQLLARLAAALSFEPEWVPLAAANDLTPLHDGRAEIMAGVAPAVHHQSPLQCFNTPYRMQEELHIYVRRGNEQLLQFQPQLWQYRVGLADGVRLPDAEFPPIENKAAPGLILRGALPDLLPALVHGNLDVLAAEAGAWSRLRVPLPANVVKTSLVIPALPIRVCLPGNADLLLRFEEIEELYELLLQ